MYSAAFAVEADNLSALMRVKYSLVCDVLCRADMSSTRRRNVVLARQATQQRELTLLVVYVHI